MSREALQALARARDADLAALAVRGDDAAAAELVRRAAPLVGDLLRRMGAEPALADDVTQEALVAALRGLGAFRGDAAFATWATSIAVRLYLKRRRKEARFDLMAEPVSVDAPGPDPAATSQARLDLDRALGRLSPAERLCVSLCHGAGMTHEEIAAAVGVPLGTVKSHVLRGMKKLRVLLVE